MGRLQTRRDGLAALELVIVVSVLVLLTGVLVPSIDRAVRASQRADAQAMLQRLADGMRDYRHDTGGWPVARPMGQDSLSVDCARDFSCLLANTRELIGWDGPYLPGADLALTDPWGQPYLVYTFSSDYCHTGGGLALVSTGPNRTVQSTPGTILAGSADHDDVVVLVAAPL